MSVSGMKRWVAAALIAATAVVVYPEVRADEAGWAALAKPGAIVLFRHANAPGVGDPAEFRIGACPTQRNLDDQGRNESRQLGKLFRERGIKVESVLHSQWCRTRDTAQLAFEGMAPLKEEPAFNSFFGRQGASDPQTAQSREILRRWKGPGVLVVVTHQVNITQLTGSVPASADGVVVRVPEGNGPLEIVGRVSP